MAYTVHDNLKGSPGPHAKLQSPLTRFYKEHVFDGTEITSVAQSLHALIKQSKDASGTFGVLFAGRSQIEVVNINAAGAGVIFLSRGNTTYPARTIDPGGVELIRAGELMDFQIWSDQGGGCKVMVVELG